MYPKAPGTRELHLEGSLPNITFSDIQTLEIAAPGNEESAASQPEAEELVVETAPGESPDDTPAETLDECILMFPPAGSEKKGYLASAIRKSYRITMECLVAVLRFSPSRR